MVQDDVAPFPSSEPIAATLDSAFNVGVPPSERDLAFKTEALLDFKSTVLTYFRQVHPETNNFGSCGTFSNMLCGVLVGIGRNIEVSSHYRVRDDDGRSLLNGGLVPT